MESRMRSAEEQRLIDARIAEIKKKEQLIKKRQQEIEEDIRLAAEQDAVVKLKPTTDDWLPGKTSQHKNIKPSGRVSFGEVEFLQEINPASKQLPYRGRGRGRRNDETRVGGPPPDPVSFLADPERDYASSETNTNHYQPRNNRPELPRQEAPKNLDENWRGLEEKRPFKPPIKTESDWRGGEKPKSVERNWRKDSTGELVRDDRSLDQDWRKPQTPQAGPVSAYNEGYSEELDHHHTQYLPNPNENARNSVDFPNKPEMPQPSFTEADSSDPREMPYYSSSKLPAQILEPVRQHAFDTLPTPASSEIPQNSVFYSNPKPTYEGNQAYRAESEDSWEGSEKSFPNQKPYKQEISGPEYWKEEDSLNFQDDRPQTVNAPYVGTQRVSSQRLEPQVPERTFRTQAIIREHEFNHESRRIQDLPSNDLKNNMFPREQYDNAMTYPGELQYEQALMQQRSQTKPPNPVYPSNYDRQTVNQHGMTNNTRQSSALNSGRPDDAYAYFQAKMAKAKAHQGSTQDFDEMQAQFVKMYQTPDRRVSAGNTPPLSASQFQYGEMNSGRPESSSESARQYAEAMTARRQMGVNSQPPNGQHLYGEESLSQRASQQESRLNQHQYAEAMGMRQSKNITPQQYADIINSARQLAPRSQSTNQSDYAEMMSSRQHGPESRHNQYSDLSSARQLAMQTQSTNQHYEDMINAHQQIPEPRSLSQHQYAEISSSLQSQSVNPQYNEMLSARQMGLQSQGTNQHEYVDRISAHQQAAPNPRQSGGQYAEMNPRLQGMVNPKLQGNVPYQYAEMNQQSAMENMSSNDMSSINDRLRKSREQALMAQHASNPQPRNHVDYQEAMEAMKRERYLEHNSAGHVLRRADENCELEDLLLTQKYPGLREERLNPNVLRSHPPVDMYTPTDQYSQYESPVVEVDSIQNESRSKHVQDDQWSAQMAEMQQLAGQAMQQSQPNWSAQPPHMNEGQQERTPQTESDSLLAFQNELVAHATDRIQARVNSALNDRLKRARDAALQERFEPPDQQPPNQSAPHQRPVGRAIKGCSQPATQPQIDSWQDERSADLANPLRDPPPTPEVSHLESQSYLPEGEDTLEPAELILPTGVDLTKPPPGIPPASVSPGSTEFSEEITAKIFASPPPTIPELNPDSDDVENLIAKPYCQYKPPSNQAFRPKLTFSLEKKGLEKGDGRSQSTDNSNSSATMNDWSARKDKVSRDDNAPSKSEPVVEKRISAAERVAKLLETPVVLPDYTPSYVLKVLGEEEIKNIKSRTTGGRNAQNVGS